MKTLYEEVIASAVELATTIQTSTSSYHFEPRMSNASRFTRYWVSKTDLSGFQMIDVATGKVGLFGALLPFSICSLSYNQRLPESGNANPYPIFATDTEAGQPSGI